MSSETEIHLEITETDIKQGVKCSSHLCPVATALDRAYNHKHNISVGTFYYHLLDNNNKSIAIYRLPQTLMNFIYNFDCQNALVKPLKITFTPEEVTDEA